MSLIVSRTPYRPYSLITCFILSIASCSQSLSAGAPANPPPAPAASAPTTAPAAGVKDTAPAEPAPLEIDVTAQGIHLFAVKVDAAQVFVELGAKTGTKIVVDDTVNRQITAQINGKTAGEVIDAITGTYGLSSAQVNGAYLISEGIPRSPSSYLLSDIDTITTQYVLAPNAKSLLPVFLQDHVKINQEQNAVVLSAPREVLRKFRQDIAQFDVPAAQIMIETLMVELTDTTTNSLSALLGYSTTRDSASTDPTTGDATYQSVGNLPWDFKVNLQALVEKGLARVRANPRIATVSGQTADIFIGQQRFLSTPVEVHDQSNNNNSGEINFIDAGIRLDVTPYTGGQGEIIVDVQPEISVFGALDPITGLPNKSTRQAQTVLRVNDGETIIIGGLTQTEEDVSRSKIPFLGDLPIIGGLFRASSRQETTTQLVIFITPHILTNAGHSTNSDEEKKLFDQFQIRPKADAAPHS